MGDHVLQRRPYAFFGLVMLYSIPIEYLAFQLHSPNMIPAGFSMTLRLVSLIVVCPALAALTLILLKEGPRGVKPWLMRLFDLGKVKPRAWLAPALLVSLVMAVGAYVLINIFVGPISNPRIDPVSVLLSFLLLVPFAAAEELGWSAYAIEPLSQRMGGLGAAVLVGAIWSVWHIVPRLLGPHSWHSLLWSGINTLELRVIMTWIFFSGGRSVASMVLLHALDNVCYSNFPNFGSHYDPFYLCIMLTLATALIVIFRDGKTMTKPRFVGAAQAPVGSSV